MKRHLHFYLFVLALAGFLAFPGAAWAEEEEFNEEEIAEELIEASEDDGLSEEELPEDELPIDDEPLQDLEDLPEEDQEPAPEATPEEVEEAREAADVLEQDETGPDFQPEDEDIPETPEIESPERTLQLLVHPVFPPFQAEQVFQPLIDYLEEVTPYEIELNTPRDFHKYWLDARRGEQPHLILEDSHMAAWRMDRYDYLPIVRAADPEQFSLLTSAEFADDELNQFVARRVSTLPAPSLGYVVLANWFPNPMQQPRTLSNAQTWMDAVEIIFAFEADAAMVPYSLVARYPNLYPVEESEEFPGLTLSVSQDVDSGIARNIAEALLVLQDNPDHYTVLNEMDVEFFEAADPDEYEGLEELLKVLFAL